MESSTGRVSGIKRWLDRSISSLTWLARSESEFDLLAISTRYRFPSGTTMVQGSRSLSCLASGIPTLKGKATFSDRDTS